MSEKVMVTVRLGADLVAAIDKAAEAGGCSRSLQLARIVEEWRERVHVPGAGVDSGVASGPRMLTEAEKEKLLQGEVEVEVDAYMARQKEKVGKFLHGGVRVESPLKHHPSCSCYVCKPPKEG